MGKSSNRAEPEWLLKRYERARRAVLVARPSNHQAEFEAPPHARTIELKRCSVRKQLTSRASLLRRHSSAVVTIAFVDIRDNVVAVRERIVAACKRGEIAELRIEWHLIGPLQSNKAAKAVELFEWVDTVDSLKLAERLNRLAGEQGKTLDVLVEINVGAEEQKAGLHPQSQELRDLLAGAERLEALQIRGLMCIPPMTDNPEESRPYFRKLRALRDDLAAAKFPRVELDEVSMGMTHDFDVAVEEGSTCVRVGTGIFGTRTSRT